MKSPDVTGLGATDLQTDNELSTISDEAIDGVSNARGDDKSWEFLTDALDFQDNEITEPSENIEDLALILEQIRKSYVEDLRRFYERGEVIGMQNILFLPTKPQEQVLQEKTLRVPEPPNQPETSTDNKVNKKHFPYRIFNGIRDSIRRITRGKKESPIHDADHPLLMESLEDRTLLAGFNDLPEVLSPDSPNENLHKEAIVWQMEEGATISSPTSTGINTNSLTETTIFSFDLEITARGRAALLSGYRGGTANRWDFEYDSNGQCRIVFYEHGGQKAISSNRQISPGEKVKVILVYDDSANQLKLYLDGKLDTTATATQSFKSGIGMYASGRNPAIGGGLEGSNLIKNAYAWSGLTPEQSYEILVGGDSEESNEESNAQENVTIEGVTPALPLHTIVSPQMDELHTEYEVLTDQIQDISDKLSGKSSQESASDLPNTLWQMNEGTTISSPTPTGINTNQLTETTIFSFHLKISETGRTALFSGYKGGTSHRWDFEFDSNGQGRIVFYEHGGVKAISSNRQFSVGEEVDVLLVHDDNANQLKLYLDGVLDTTATVSQKLTSGVKLWADGRSEEVGGGLEGTHQISGAKIWSGLSSEQSTVVTNAIINTSKNSTGEVNLTEEEIAALKTEYTKVAGKLSGWAMEKRSLSHQIDVLSSSNIQSESLSFGGIQNNLDNLVLLPEKLGGSVSIQSWGGNVAPHAEGPVDADHPPASLAASGDFVTLDAHGLYRKATGFSLKVHDFVQTEESALPVNAIIYRGQQHVATINPDENGTFSFSTSTSLSTGDSDGFTCVILQNTNPDNLSSFKVSDLTFEGDTHAAPTTAEPISPMSNPVLGLSAHNFPEYNPSGLMQVRADAPGSGVTWWDSSDSFPPAGETLGFQHMETGKYQRFELKSYGGNGAKIEGLVAITENGAHPIPESMYRLYGDSTIVVAPGVPRFLGMKTSGSGDIAIHPKEAGDTLEEVAPIERAEISTDIRYIGSPFGKTNHIQNVTINPNEQTDMLFPGGAYGVRAVMTNPGTIGTGVEIQLVAGHTGTEIQTISSTIDISLEGNQSKELITDISIPGGAGKAYIYIAAVLPDGRLSSEYDAGRSASEKRTYSDRDIERLARADRKARDAIALGGDVRIAHLFKDPEITIAKLDSRIDMYAQIQQQILVAGGAPIERGALEVALAENAGHVIASKIEDPNEMQERLEEEQVSLEEQQKETAGTLVAALGGDSEDIFLASSSYEKIQPSTNSLDRWYATAGEGPIDVNWSVEVKEQGNYQIKIDGLEDWDLENASIVIPGLGTYPIDRHNMLLIRRTDSFVLQPGAYNLSIENIGVPTTPSVNDAKFHLYGLVGEEMNSKFVSYDMESKFIADHAEEFLDDGTSFRVQGVENRMNVHGLINHFAPILHFHEDERFAVPFDVDEFLKKHPIGIMGSSEAEMDLSEYRSKEEGGTGEDFGLGDVKSTVYASVLRNPEKRHQVAINYYFFFPRSNWEEHGGYNTHEGDWEGATIFLEQNGDGVWEPDEVAVGQHVKSVASDGGDRISWNGYGLEKEGDHVKLYVGLGSHAIYITPGTTPVKTPTGVKQEDHYGDIRYRSIWNVDYLPRIGGDDTSSLPSWLRYAGQWGAEDLSGLKWSNNVDGDDGPLGPAFQKYGFGSGARWLNPWLWRKDFSGPTEN